MVKSKEERIWVNIYGFRKRRYYSEIFYTKEAAIMDYDMVKLRWGWKLKGRNQIELKEGRFD